MSAMLGCAAGCTAQQIACDDEIGICTADAAGAFLRDAARTYIADFAAGAGQPEGALRFLTVKSVKGRVAAKLLHMQQHFAHCRIRCLLQYILPGGEGLTVGGDCLHIILYAAVGMRMCSIMVVRVPVCVLMDVIVGMRML